MKNYCREITEEVVYESLLHDARNPKTEREEFLQELERKIAAGLITREQRGYLYRVFHSTK